MAKPKVTAESFLKNMGIGGEEPPPAVPVEGPRKGRGAAANSPRDGLKHFGGYIGTEAAEQIAILRARLKLDNSKLIERAIQELYDRETAARKFGDR